MAKPRKIIIAGNWKMNSLAQETDAFFATLKARSHEFVDPQDAPLFEKQKLSVVLCPPYLCLERAQIESGHLTFPIGIAAQNAHWEKKGAFTGEISGPMLQAIGIEASLVGHSERRQYFGETDLTVQKKAFSLLEQGLQVILCIGETRAERDQGQTHEVLARQLRVALPEEPMRKLKNAFKAQGLRLEDRLVLAYEPIWAIGTGLTATPQQAQEAHHLIRSHSAEFQNLSILYGGSVTPENIDSLLRCPDVDGALVGGASLKVDSFLKLVQAGCRVCGT